MEDVEPLYRQEDIVYFDRYGDGDPYEDEQYVENFRLILEELRTQIRLDFVTEHGKVYSWFYSQASGIPIRTTVRFIRFRGRIRTISRELTPAAEWRIYLESFVRSTRRTGL